MRARESSGIAHYGEEAWDSFSNEENQILDVNYVSNRSQWVTASVPVELLPDGQWAIPASLLVKGGSAAVPMSDAYVFHMLADVTNPDNIVHTDYMDGYVEAHSSRKQAALLKRKRKL